MLKMNILFLILLSWNVAFAGSPIPDNGLPDVNVKVPRKKGDSRKEKADAEVSNKSSQNSSAKAKGSERKNRKTNSAKKDEDKKAGEP